jgi:hypothetical protein
MRPVTVKVDSAVPDAPVLTFARGSVILNWTDGTPVNYLDPATWNNPKNEIGYRIERAVVTGGIAGAFTQVAVGLANTTTYTDLPSDPTLTYDYRVTAFNKAGGSASNTVRVEGLPAAPTGLTAVVQLDPAMTAGAKVALNWTNNASNATGVVVERAIGSGAFSELAVLAATDTSYIDQSVLPGAYSYRVHAVNAVGPSANAGPATVTVAQPASATVVVSNLNPSAVGDGVTFTATVSPLLATAIPTGVVSFDINGVTTAATLDAAGVANVTSTTLPAGTFTITASYGGDAIFLPSSGSVVQTVDKTATTTVVVSNLNPSTFGQPVTFTATVSPSTATGSVDFSVDGTLTSVALVGGQATYSTSALAVGGHVIGASYGGDTTYLGSTSTTFTQTVGPVLRATSTVITSNRNPAANLGQSVTFTATVSPVSGTGIPGGTVQFTIDGGNVGGVLALNAQGRAAFTTNTLAAGSHNVVATYSGSAIFAGGSSATFVQVVNKGTSTTTLTRSRTTSVFGQSVTFTARVLPVAAIGTVTFTVDGVAGSPVPLDATGRARLVTTTLAVGTHTVSAAYGGSGNYAPSTSATLTNTVTRAASRAIVTTSGTPAGVGTPVVFTTTVTAVAPGVGVPTGNVTFTIAGAGGGTAVVALNSSGQAAFATSTLAVGRHVVSAVYNGDGNFNADPSNTLTQRIR